MWNILRVNQIYTYLLSFVIYFPLFDHALFLPYRLLYCENVSQPLCFFVTLFFHLRLTTWTAVRATCYWGLSLCCSLLSPPGIFPALCCIPIPPPSHLSTDSLIITCPYFAFAIRRTTVVVTAAHLVLVHG